MRLSVDLLRETYISRYLPSERLGLAPQFHSIHRRILEASDGLDLVGIYAQGGISRGFANSFGQRNWFSTHSFNFDWSCYAHDDKAVKSSFAGFEWNQGEFEGKVQEARHQLGILDRPARTIEPGGYRVYLAPSALQEILGIMASGGFGKRSHATRQTAFLKMIEGKASLNPAVSIAENLARADIRRGQSLRCGSSERVGQALSEPRP